MGRIAGRLDGDTLPLDNIERIEIVRGPQSALYGSDGIGGVVNIITKKPKDRFSLTTGISSSFILAYDDPLTSKQPGPFDNVNPFREQRLSAALGLPIGVTRNRLSLRFSRGDFYMDEGERGSILPRYLRGQGSLDTVLSPTELTELHLGGSFMFLRSDRQINVAGSLSRSDYIRSEGFAGFDLFPLPELTLNFRLYDNFYRRSRSAYAASTDTWANTGQEENENTLTLEAAGTWAGFSQWLLSGGFEASYNSMSKFNLTEKVKGMDREAVFFQAERFKDKVYSVLGGFRVERNSLYGFSAAPKISAMYHLPKGFRVLGSAGVGYRSPNFNDLYLEKDDPPHPLILGNPDLKPEYAVNAGASLEYAHRRGSVTVNGYYTELFDEITYINTGRVERGMVVYDTENLSRSLRTGVDTEGKVSFLTRWYVSAGYSYVYAYDRGSAAELHPQPRHTVKFRLGLDTARSGGAEAAPKKVTLAAWTGGRFFSAVETLQGRSANRFILDAYAAVNFIPHFKFYLSADNILGTIDQFFGPSTPQTFSLGLNYTY
jgi:outer membrane receptor for ferrienterochelin and colicins